MSQELKRLGSMELLRIRSSKMQFTGIDIDDLILVRDTLRAAAIDRAPKQPHDNRLVDRLFRLARIFDELAGA